MVNSNYLYLNTRDNKAGTRNYDATFNLKLPENLDNTSCYVSVESVSFPNSVYAVNSNYNTLELTDAGGSDTITLTQQNYSGVQLATELQTQLNASGTLSGTFTVSYDTQTFKLTISSTAAFTIDGGTALHIIGVSSVPTTSSTSYTSDSVVRLDGTMYIDLVSSLASRSYSTTDERSNVLFRIPVDSAVGNVITYRNTSEENRIKVNTTSLKTAQFRLFDDRGNVFLLDNNSHVSYTIRFTPII